MQSRRTLTITSLLAFAATLVMFASSATALDGYEDRKRVFGGFDLGAGAGAVHSGDTTDLSAFKDGYNPGFHASAILGGGVTDAILLGAQADWWFRNVQKGDDQKYALQQWDIMFVGNFFPVDGFHIDVGAGAAYGAFTGEHPSVDLPLGEMGFGGKLGVGYEFWLNGNTTLGFNLAYTRNFYSNGAFDMFNGGIGIRWY